MSVTKKTAGSPKAGAGTSRITITPMASKKASAKGQPVLISNMRAPGSIGFEDALRQYGPALGAQELMDREKDAAEWSMETGIYGVWRCPAMIKDHSSSSSSSMSSKPLSYDDTPFPHPSSSSYSMERARGPFDSVSDGPPTDKSDPNFLDFCARIGPKCKCFCGHYFADHDQNPVARRGASTKCHLCACKRYEFIPTRPEEVGDYYLVRRKDFDVRQWRVKCRCGHAHDQHSPSSYRSCTQCGCSSFIPHFCCVTCQKMAEEHETVWETREERIEMGYKVDEAYFPLSSTPEIQKLAFDPALRAKAKARSKVRPKKALTSGSSSSSSSSSSYAGSSPSASSSSSSSSSTYSSPYSNVSSRSYGRK